MKEEKNRGGTLWERMIKRGGDAVRSIRRMGIQTMVLVSFTVVAVLIMLILAITLYQGYMQRSRVMMTESAQHLLSQTEANLEDYLTAMRRISDAMYYNVIKDKDLGRDSLDSEMYLLYEANKENLISFALFKRDGSLVSAAPVSPMKQDVDF